MIAKIKGGDQNLGYEYPVFLEASVRNFDL